ncbi:hypothetical protein CGC20_17075 [Leishmania donovani]|uniref:Uncharacterized protein n=1 Tax=Leishmania donovani TaxID=5661 RepID=A0A504XRW9_LEIDO|nr:hypothetical protein CGC20_17075 [Leishmania donovani]
MSLKLAVLASFGAHSGQRWSTGNVTSGVSNWAMNLKLSISAITASTRRYSSGLHDGEGWRRGSGGGSGHADRILGDVAERLSDRQDEREAAEEDDAAAWGSVKFLPFQDAGWDAPPSSSSAFSATASPDPLPPQSDPTAVSERAALDQRRRLFAQCTELADVVQEELRAEVARDMKDGVAAVPPLAPSGWRVLHTTGSSYFTMSRLKKGCYVDSRALGRRANDNGDSPLPASDMVPRYRSVHDLVTGGGRPPRSAKRDDAAAEREMWVLRRGRYTAAQDGQAAPQRNSPAGDEGDCRQHGGSRRRDAVRYARSDMHITLFAPFRSLDLTLYNPRVGICEWTRFDLRVRSLQFVSHKLARALEEHAVFGKGEPLYLEMLRRLPMDVSFHKPSQRRGSSSLERKAQPSTVSAASPFDRSGEYARTFAYAGPYITELSKELREALSEYIMMDVGITNEVAEYVCQMQFFLEQEEYVGWLAQWMQLAATLKQTL